MDRYNGLLPVRKETGSTSHDVVRRLRRITGAEKLGHTGTLDPMASGLLLITLGRATKLTQFLTEWDKSYLAEITLGLTSDTLDGDGQITAAGAVPDMDIAQLRDLVSGFIGRSIQQVPAYSAVKVAGRELYKYVRKGIRVEAPRREVEIKTIEIMAYAAPRLTMKVCCSKGTYIRALADDIGKAVGCGGHLSALERLQVGPFDVAAALTINEVQQHHDAGTLASSVQPVETVLPFPVLRVRDRVAETIRHGRRPGFGEVIDHRGTLAAGGLFGMVNEAGEILAVGRSKYDAVLLAGDHKGDFFDYVRVLI
jgi:tRNA pseudouridine55 synthase